jgi:uncharacterized protein YjiS (DUF1127 family)
MVRLQQQEANMRTATTCPQQRISLGLQPPATTLGGRFGRLARRWWGAYWDRRARQATVLILRSLDDRTLHDIGINPSEIESCVYSLRQDRKRLYVPRWRG